MKRQFDICFYIICCVRLYLRLFLIISYLTSWIICCCIFLSSNINGPRSVTNSAFGHNDPALIHADAYGSAASSSSYAPLVPTHAPPGSLQTHGQQPQPQPGPGTGPSHHGQPLVGGGLAGECKGGMFLLFFFQ
jgi:hypothetical protein